MPVELPLIAAIFALLAATIHVYIFILESLQWNRESTRRTFGVRSAADAELLKPMAFNQGFYNLFLAVGALLGIWLARVPTSSLFGVGVGMLLLALGSMVGAALVLVLSNRRMARAAAIQGTMPLVALLLLFILG